MLQSINGQVESSTLHLHPSLFEHSSLFPPSSVSHHLVLVFHLFRFYCYSISPLSFLHIDVPSVFLPILSSHSIPHIKFPSLTPPSVAPSPPAIALLSNFTHTCPLFRLSCPVSPARLSINCGQRVTIWFIVQSVLYQPRHGILFFFFLNLKLTGNGKIVHRLMTPCFPSDLSSHTNRHRRAALCTG